MSGRYAADPGTHESFPSYSPDGAKIVYVTDAGDGALVVADADGSNPEPIPIAAEIAVFETNPDWAVKEAPPADTTAPETTITKKPKKRISKRSSEGPL